MNNMKSLYIVLGVLVLCNIAVAGTTSFDVPDQWRGVWNADTTDTLSIDSLATDTLAIDSLAKDSAVVDSLVKDSAVVDSLAKDTLAVDSLANDSIVADSLARISMETTKRVYVYFKEKQEPDPDKNKVKRFIVLYKKNLAKKTLEGYATAYLPWKGAFDACERRTLDMYMDGIAILFNMVSKDTLEHKYDKLIERREQLMELYDLAVDNLDDLNSQIDRKRTTDTLSVAKLRAAQYDKYKDLWVLDSIYNSSDTLHNVYNDENVKYWSNAPFFNDSVNRERLYPILKDIVFSNDNNIGKQGYNLYLVYSGFFKAKYASLINKNKSNKQYVKKYLKPEIDSIRTYVGKRYSEYMEAYPSYISKDDKNYAAYIDNINKIQKEIVSELNRLDQAFISGNDWPALEAMFNERMAKEGMTDDLRDEILRTLSGAPNSELYFQMLASLYEKEPMYENALKVAEYTYKAKRYDDAYTYYDKIIKLHEFEIFDLEDEEKLKIYLGRANAYDKNFTEKSAGQCVRLIELLQGAIGVCSYDYRAYLAIGMCYLNNSKKLKGPNEVLARAAYMSAYDWLLKAKDKFAAQKSESEKYANSNINLSDDLSANIEKIIRSAYSGLPQKQDIFMYNYKEGQTVPYMKINGKTLTVTIRTQK